MKLEHRPVQDKASSLALGREDREGVGSQWNAFTSFSRSYLICSGGLLQGFGRACSCCAQRIYTAIQGQMHFDHIPVWPPTQRHRLLFRTDYPSRYPVATCTAANFKGLPVLDRWMLVFATPSCSTTAPEAGSSSGRAALPGNAVPFRPARTVRAGPQTTAARPRWRWPRRWAGWRARPCRGRSVRGSCG